MRILHTTHSYAPEVSGVAEVVSQISTRLRRRGYEVHVATAAVCHTPQEETLNKVHVYRFKVEGNAVLGMTGDVDRYVHFVQSESWDVVAMHCAQGWTIDALLPYLDHIKAAKIFVGHGFSAYHDPIYRSYFHSLAKSLTKVDKIVALSDLLEEGPFCAKHRLPTPQIISNGVDIAAWDVPTRDIRHRWGIARRPWLLSVSHHSRVKGHPTFFKVLREIRTRLPGAMGTIVGGHYPAAKWKLGRLGIKGGCWYRCWLASALGCDAELRWNVPRADVVSAVQEADIVLVTSSREASPLVVLESMAAGTPWISFNVGCVRENAGGIVVGSREEMAACVVELLGNPNQRQMLAQKGRKEVREKHDWELITIQYEQLYKTILQTRRN